jgi:exosortase A-associated hydrolase 2
LTAAPELALEPFFLRGVAGRLFCLYVAPRSAASQGVLFVPPFAEEMNRCRRQVVLQARELAAAGYGVLLVDLFGTGDSEGDFVDGRWEVWRADLLEARRWLANRGVENITLWALRWGALLAAELTGEIGDLAQRLVLWQPVSSGRQYMDQFIRLRVAASMLKDGGGAVSVRALRELLDRGEAIEVAGYELHPELVREIDSRSLAARPPPAGLTVDWTEIGDGADGALTPASAKVVSSWGAAGVSVEAAVIPGEPFWATTEVTVVPRLTAYTTARLTGSV